MRILHPRSHAAQAICAAAAAGEDGLLGVTRAKLSPDGSGAARTRGPQARRGAAKFVAPGAKQAGRGAGRLYKVKC